MAVEFISYGYDTAPGAGLGELTWQEMHPQIGSASYGVRAAGDWKVTKVAGADRTVSIAAGRGWGLGVIDKTVANDTIQLDSITSGSRWDLIAVRRDPTPTGGESKFVKINGGTTMVIPGGRLAGPGIHDQPLALVQVIAGQTQPGIIVDLRTWAVDGGMVAAHDLVRTYLNQVGTRVHILGTEWVRQMGGNDVPQWFTPNVAPYRQWFGTTTLTLDNEGGAWTVPLPAGHFTVKPMVFLTKQSNSGAGYVPYFISSQSSTSGLRVGAYWKGNATDFEVTLGIHAVQPNPHSSGGVPNAYIGSE